MRTTILALGLILTASFVFADDKKSGNELKVKINHKYNIGQEVIRDFFLKNFDKNGDGKVSEIERPSREDTTKFFTTHLSRTIQFKYDTKEWLHITNRPEGYTGVFLRRDEAAKFKAIVEKMLKFGSAVYENQITGVEKKFEGEEAILPKQVRGTRIAVTEAVSKPFSKAAVKVVWVINDGRGEVWDLCDLEEIQKVFDERQKEVFKKYDILKALND